eukprot:Awhi_evm1s5129
MTLNSFESLNLLNSEEGLNYLSKTFSINEKDLKETNYIYPSTPLTSPILKGNDNFKFDINKFTQSTQYDPFLEFSIHDMDMNENNLKKNSILKPKPSQVTIATYLPLRRTRPKKKAKTRANYMHRLRSILFYPWVVKKPFPGET